MYVLLGIAAMIFGYFWFRLYQEQQIQSRLSRYRLQYDWIWCTIIRFSEAGNKGWGSAEIVTMFIIGAIFIAAFVIRELTMRAPMLNLEVLKSSTFTLTTIINMVVMMSLFGGMILLPIYLQNLRGFSALDSGLLLLPGSLVMGILGPITGKLLDTIGLKPLALFGM